MAAARAEAALAAATQAPNVQAQNASQGSSAGISAPLDPRFNFDNFVVGKPNELAYPAARRVADAPTPPFNPLFLYGGVAPGKPHLMHSISLPIKTPARDRRLISPSAEKAIYPSVRPLPPTATLAPRD